MQIHKTEVLKTFADDDLEAELARRKAAKAATLRPKMIPSAQLSDAIKVMLEENMAQVEAEGYTVKDLDHYIFEAAMEELYGKTVWGWYNKAVK